MTAGDRLADLVGAQLAAGELGHVRHATILPPPSDDPATRPTLLDHPRADRRALVFAEVKRDAAELATMLVEAAVAGRLREVSRLRAALDLVGVHCASGRVGDAHSVAAEALDPRKVLL